MKQKGIDYDIAAAEIRCNADKIGAEVFALHTDRAPVKVRVLAHSREDARLALQRTPATELAEALRLS